ncbi:GNAT family N-acetyltransferase [uncultured Nocardioides sp.]|uniref:GNAT family N-acetyltransferase n=1 Tax=uncultured Nocardioides sp. TaxID=198441 RepID=UPI002615369C|nr:GNAT family N-acetyltransferase [uncultured Nocardioides sp.]
MARRTVDLEPAHVDALAALAGCTGWLRTPGGGVVDKAAWIAEVREAWGGCGLVSRLDGVPVAYVVYAPPAHLPGLGRVPTAPVSRDALVLAELWVHPDHRGGGLGRHLVRSMARELVDRHGPRVPAVETFAGSATRTADATEPCLRPPGFCAAVGFTERRAHPVVSRWRLELRAAVDWRGGVEQAWERLRAGVRPLPGRAAPAGRTSREAPRSTKPREADLPGLS